MLFDPRPKESIHELFDREEELQKLRQALQTPLTLLLGIRRIGKTSILKSFLNSIEAPYIYVDLRQLEESGYSRSSLYRLLSDAFSNISPKWSESILRYFRGLRGVSISGFSVEFDWRENNLTIIDILRRLNDFASNKVEKGYAVVSLDEAQHLRMMRGGKGRLDMRNVLAYCYDNFKALRFILTGSEVGLLLDFLGLADPSSPLYGRYVTKITIESFSREKSLEFLRRGFKEAQIVARDEDLYAIVDRLAGIAGWLAYYGYACVVAGQVSDTVVKEVTEKALLLVSKELEKLFSRSTYYKYALRAIAIGRRQWSRIKEAVEAWSGRSMLSPEITRILNTLIDLGIVVKVDDNYDIADPLVKTFCREKL